MKENRIEGQVRSKATFLRTTLKLCKISTIVRHFACNNKVGSVTLTTTKTIKVEMREKWANEEWKSESERDKMKWLKRER